MENNNSAVAEQQKTVSIKRTFNIPLDSVWKAWTDPETFRKWWGPEGYTCPYCSIDFVVGGKYLASMQGEDGKEIWSTGMYKEIVPREKIVVTDSFSDSKGNIVPASDYDMAGEWPSALIVTVEFAEVDGKTNMSLQQVGIPEQAYEDCVKGWQSSFDKFERNIK